MHRVSWEGAGLPLAFPARVSVGNPAVRGASVNGSLGPKPHKVARSKACAFVPVLRAVSILRIRRRPPASPSTPGCKGPDTSPRRARIRCSVPCRSPSRARTRSGCTDRPRPGCSWGKRRCTDGTLCSVLPRSGFFPWNRPTPRTAFPVQPFPSPRVGAVPRVVHFTRDTVEIRTMVVPKPWISLDEVYKLPFHLFPCQNGRTRVPLFTRQDPLGA